MRASWLVLGALAFLALRGRRAAGALPVTPEGEAIPAAAAPEIKAAGFSAAEITGTAARAPAPTYRAAGMAPRKPGTVYSAKGSRAAPAYSSTRPSSKR